MTTAELMPLFYAEHPEHIAGIHTRAVDPAGVEHTALHLDSESLRAFFVWLVRHGHRPRAVVERAWMVYHSAAPGDFPMPFPWTVPE